MARCACAAAEAAGITKDPWHTQPHLQPATLVTIDTVPFVGETPMETNWNELGYAINGAQSVCVNVE
jgi:hypothetical protein